jgi:hypothetical protein
LIATREKRLRNMSTTFTARTVKLAIAAIIAAVSIGGATAAASSMASPAGHAYSVSHVLADGPADNPWPT